MANNIKDNSLVGIRSIQNLSFNWLGSSEFGRLTPIHVQELLPTDKVKTCAPRLEMSMLPLGSPTFGSMSVYVHYFFVPHRLVWSSANDFLSQSGSNANAVPPYWTLSDFRKVYGLLGDAGRSLHKHWSSFGLPPFYTNSSYDPSATFDFNDYKITTLPFRAYNKIWWDYYRDPEVLPDSNESIYLNTNDGHDSTLSNDIKYFPKSRSLTDAWFAELFASNGTTPSGLYTGLARNSSNNAVITSTQIVQESSGSSASALRRIEALTRMAERMSLSGKRQIDKFFARYGVRPEFTKLQMAEYVGGAKSSVLVSDITSSADTYDQATKTGTPVGQQSAKGYSVLNDLNIHYTAKEHGYLIGILSVVPHIHYTQGIDARWFRNNITDFFTKELEHVGQIAVPKHAIRVAHYDNDVDRTADLDTFAFTNPYYEYRHNPDIICGDFATYFYDGNLNEDPNITDNGIAYMQSMGLYTDYPYNRLFNQDNLTIKPGDSNKIFFYSGGRSIWSNADDHFHININTKCIIDRPMDGYAVPTLETTEMPHVSTTPVGSSTVL